RGDRPGARGNGSDGPSALGVRQGVAGARDERAPGRCGCCSPRTIRARVQRGERHVSERRVDRVREILDLAMERPSAERAAYVAGAAGADEVVRAEVLSLLGALDGAGDALEPPRAAHSEPTPAEPLTGLSFGPYVVGERIGEGGMGVVYATRDSRLGRTVAVKALPPSLARDPHRRARLEREARLLATLNHPNIAAVYGIEDTPRGPVVVMEFVPGQTLAEEIASRRRAVDQCISIARRIARG